MTAWRDRLFINNLEGINTKKILVAGLFGLSLFALTGCRSSPHVCGLASARQQTAMITVTHTGELKSDIPLVSITMNYDGTRGDLGGTTSTSSGAGSASATSSKALDVPVSLTK